MRHISLTLFAITFIHGVVETLTMVFSYDIEAVTFVDVMLKGIWHIIDQTETDSDHLKRFVVPTSTDSFRWDQRR